MSILIKIVNKIMLGPYAFLIPAPFRVKKEKKGGCFMSTSKIVR